MQGFLITAYKDYIDLKQKLTSLSPYVKCYVHVDAKCDITEDQCKELMTIPGVFVTRKFKVKWGSMAHLRAILLLMEQALKDTEVSYYHVISAQDFPAIPHTEFLTRFENDRHIYMQSLKTTDYPQLEYRYRHYHFMDMINYQDQSDRIQNWVGRIDRWQEKLHINRQFVPEKKGLVWVSMPRDAAYEAVYSKHAEMLINKLRYMYIPEEFYFQNVFDGTEFERQIICDSLRFSIWRTEDSPSPDILTDQDIPAIDASGCVFARKVVAGTEVFSQLSDRWKY